MKKLCLLLALISPCAVAQKGEWTTVGLLPKGPTLALTKYQPDATPYWRGWTKPVYDDLNKGLLIYLANPDCCGGVYVNSMFLYNVESNTWKVMFSHTTSKHSTNQLMVGLSRNNNVVSVTLKSPEEWPADPSLHSYLGFGSCKAPDGTRTPLLDPSFATKVPTRVTLNIPPPGDNATNVTQFSFSQTGQDTVLSCPTSIQPGVPNCGCAWGLLDSDDTPTDGHPYHQMTWDSTRHLLYRAFGSSDSYFSGVGLWTGDGPSNSTYMLNTSSGVGVWNQLCGDLTTPCNVPIHQESAMTYVPDTDRVVLTSGLNGSDTSDTWELNPVTHTWTQVCATSVCGNKNLPQTDAPGFVYFPDIHKAVLFGGAVPSGGGPCQTKPGSACNNETWVYDSTNKSAPNYGWTQVLTSHVPPTNKFPVIDYVPMLHKVIMVDYDPNGSHLWAFDGVDWTDLTASGQVPVGPELAQSWTKNNIGGWDSNANAFVVMSEPDTGSYTNSGPPEIWKIVFAPTSPAPFASFSPGSLAFAPQSLGTTSAPQTVTLTNTGNQPLAISSITISGKNKGDFAQANNCPLSPTTVAPNGSCTIQVTFTPSTTSLENAWVSVSDNAPGTPQTVNLNGGTNGGSGGGGGGGSTFTISASPSTATVHAGQSATYQVTVTASGGPFSNPVALSCLNPPATISCTFTPASVIPGSGSAMSTLTVSTASAFARNVSPRGRQGSWPLGVMFFLPIGALWMCAGSPRKDSSRRRLLIGLILLLACAGMTLQVGCGNTTSNPATKTSSSSSVSPTTFTVTIVGTSGSQQATTNVSLIVN